MLTAVHSPPCPPVLPLPSAGLPWPGRRGGAGWRDGSEPGGPPPRLLGVAPGQPGSCGLGAPAGPALAAPHLVLCGGCRGGWHSPPPRGLSRQLIPGTGTQGTPGGWGSSPAVVRVQGDLRRPRPPVQRGEGGLGDRAWHEACVCPLLPPRARGPLAFSLGDLGRGPYFSVSLSLVRQGGCR